LLRRWHAQTQPCAADTAGALGAVTFGTPGQDAALKCLSVHVPLDALGPARAPDLWRGIGAARVERIDDVAVATDGERLFGCIEVDEVSAGGPRAAAHRTYASIFAALGRSNCIHPLRFWNYVPRINEPLDGLERYRHFNIGRQQAFLAARRAAFAGAPAACALGTTADKLVVYFVAAAQPPTPLENPRQVSAYNYPAEYGPRTPTFSRATLTTDRDPALFISGTASIVGHRSEHPGDPSAQTRETFENLRALIGEANARCARPAFSLDRLTYTVYVRHPADLAAVRAQFTREVGASSQAARDAVFLRADICRAELLVEIEATSSLV
jgi:enamine deaminase RidA (YjgF/YER057c/UK114 family)